MKVPTKKCVKGTLMIGEVMLMNLQSKTNQKGYHKCTKEKVVVVYVVEVDVNDVVVLVDNVFANVVVTILPI